MGSALAVHKHKQPVRSHAFAMLSYRFRKPTTVRDNRETGIEFQALAHRESTNYVSHGTIPGAIFKDE